ncbi:flagellar brake protein [Bdellovibrio svalbardensis]|uniref:PilZ domain-containing protein n=1 Tax=Bdellovibrio svalbardensis TaxID=2972972 RepID=A0ABT6DJ79_9BACT|nr:PilZ domain-containing protein [Bdellovibrio svalbardensis]MDG0816914.1 PilZ domain-containing protein [Bdellovibrio svalbardensis]
MDKEIFSLISKVEEKTKLFQDLANARGEILCKGQDENLVKLRVQTYTEKTQFLDCISESQASLKNDEEFLGYFFLGGEKYYFEGKIIAYQNRYSVQLPTELYHLQRRQNYRVKVPDGYTSSFNIITVNGKASNIIGQLADISSQGCRVIYRMDNPLMKVGDQVVGHLIVGKRAPFELQGIVRHIKVDEGNKVIQTFGIEFTPLSPILENKLFAITMELHKEIFKRP